jgi:hypothetical protein
MIELLKWGKILVAILKDGKVTKAELPEFLEALAGVVAALVTIILPFLAGQAGTLAKRLAGGVKVAATEARK